MSDMNFKGFGSSWRTWSYCRLWTYIFSLQVLKLSFCPHVIEALNCDQTFRSSVSSVGSKYNHKNGTFHAPAFLNGYGHVQQCTHLFEALPSERVSIDFENFKLERNEYIDFYTEIPKSTLDVGPLSRGFNFYSNTTTTLSSPLSKHGLVSTPFGGRYSGSIHPRQRISLYNSLVFVFTTSQRNVTVDKFAGSFRFISDARFQLSGSNTGSIKRVDHHDENTYDEHYYNSRASGENELKSTAEKVVDCNYEIFSTSSNDASSGDFTTPTYPGVYPNDVFCSYKFMGRIGERVRVEFRDFDLHYGGIHCPMDFVTIFDGADNLSPKIGTYCGQLRNLVLYSTSNTLYVTFTSVRRHEVAQNRGFSANYKFSADYVKLDFIQRNAEHLRGSECDQLILSQRESSGHIFSPNYPFPFQAKVVCRYFIYGLYDDQDLERVLLRFEKFDIPIGESMKESSIDSHFKGNVYPSSFESDHHTNLKYFNIPPDEQTEVTQCMDGFLRVYRSGQEKSQRYDQFDEELCGKKLPQLIKTSGPRLALLFYGGKVPGSGFKATYTFETEYLIPNATPAPDGSCYFTYRASSQLSGNFNSPRNPFNYPSNISCTYIFMMDSPVNHFGQHNTQAMIVFNSFKVRADKTFEDSVDYWRSYGRDKCVEDYVEIFELYRDQEEVLVGRYCAMSAPGPVISSRNGDAIGLKVYLHTDAANVFSGFAGRYNFFQAKSFMKGCGFNVTGGDENGIITSPNYPNKYSTSNNLESRAVCDWFIKVRPNNRILLHFIDFEVEGEPMKRGCPAATLRVWPWPKAERSKTALELCGDNLGQKSQILSQNSELSLSFYLANKAVGAKGFKAVWTEILRMPDDKNGLCRQFLCHHTKYCISNSLKCNGIFNCGLNDRSDEIHCGAEGEVDEYFVLGITLALTSCAFLLIFVIWHRRNRYQRFNGKVLSCDLRRKYQSKMTILKRKNEDEASITRSIRNVPRDHIKKSEELSSHQSVGSSSHDGYTTRGKIDSFHDDPLLYGGSVGCVKNIASGGNTFVETARQTTTSWNVPSDTEDISFEDNAPPTYPSTYDRSLKQKQELTLSDYRGSRMTLPCGTPVIVRKGSTHHLHGGSMRRTFHNGNGDFHHSKMDESGRSGGSRETLIQADYGRRDNSRPNLSASSRQSLATMGSTGNKISLSGMINCDFTASTTTANSTKESVVVMDEDNMDSDNNNSEREISYKQTLKHCNKFTINQLFSADHPITIYKNGGTDDTNPTFKDESFYEDDDDVLEEEEDFSTSQMSQSNLSTNNNCGRKNVQILISSDHAMSSAQKIEMGNTRQRSLHGHHRNQYNNNNTSESIGGRFSHRSNEGVQLHRSPSLGRDHNIDEYPVDQQSSIIEDVHEMEDIYNKDINISPTTATYKVVRSKPFLNHQIPINQDFVQTPKHVGKGDGGVGERSSSNVYVIDTSRIRQDERYNDSSSMTDTPTNYSSTAMENQQRTFVYNNNAVDENSSMLKNNSRNVEKHSSYATSHQHTADIWTKRVPNAYGDYSDDEDESTTTTAEYEGGDKNDDSKEVID